MKREYSPFGTCRHTGPVSQYAAHDYDGSFANVHHTFTDPEHDDEYAFSNYKTRFYDPVPGRLISSDSIIPEPGDLQASDRYGYCVNNPLVYGDPSGNFL